MSKNSYTYRNISTIDAYKVPTYSFNFYLSKSINTYIWIFLNGAQLYYFEAILYKYLILERTKSLNYFEKINK